MVFYFRGKIEELEYPIRKTAKMSKTTKIADEVKFYRLVPLALAIAYIWSISTIMMGETPSGGVAEFIGYYIGVGLPRFAVYLFCLGFILYNYNKITDGGEGYVVWCGILLVFGIIIVAPYNQGREIHVGHYLCFFGAELVLYKEYLTLKPNT
jgi:hypothetical protein